MGNFSIHLTLNNLRGEGEFLSPENKNTAQTDCNLQVTVNVCKGTPMILIIFGEPPKTRTGPQSADVRNAGSSK